ncbi:MAG: Hsp20/alpha crystallin family protein [Actinomycetes bacterium]
MHRADWPDLFAPDMGLLPAWMGATCGMMRVEEYVENSTMVVRAERHEETKQEDRRGYRTEFRYGAFTRTIPVSRG